MVGFGRQQRRDGETNSVKKQKTKQNRIWKVKKSEREEKGERVSIEAAGWCRGSRNARGLFNARGGSLQFSALLASGVLPMPPTFPSTELRSVRKCERMGRGWRKVAPYISVHVEPEMKANPQDAEGAVSRAQRQSPE